MQGHNCGEIILGFLVEIVSFAQKMFLKSKK